jgi:hypothetical protein
MKVKTINTTTGIVEVREMTSDEIFSFEQHEEHERLAREEKQRLIEARSVAEAKLLELGLTTEDLKALLG